MWLRCVFVVLFAVALLLTMACNSSTEGNTDTTTEAVDSLSLAQAKTSLPYKISLAQWSLNRRYREDQVDPYLFARHAKALGFEGIEYVTQLYAADLAPVDGDIDLHQNKVLAVAARLDSAAKAEGITQVLLMVDNEGDLASTNEQARQRAIQNHQHWIGAAASMGVPTVRVNAGGAGSRRQMHDLTVKSLRSLGSYAQPLNVNVVVENHGGNSSEPNFLASVMQAVAMDNVGILPDFGNWCRQRGEGAGCLDEVPADSIYHAVGLWMPYAHAVSAKSYNFTAEGNETKIDYQRMMDTVLAHGYTGFVGVEYEGAGPEVSGIQATKALLERVGRTK